MNRIFGGYAKADRHPWKVYPAGVLFGLGFDTATEVAMLVLAGTAVVSGPPFYAILSLPVLFAAGMCLFDTADGCFMNFANDIRGGRSDEQGGTGEAAERPGAYRCAARRAQPATGLSAAGHGLRRAGMSYMDLLPTCS
jgi:hypothetical protein